MIYDESCKKRSSVLIVLLLNLSTQSAQFEEVFFNQTFFSFQFQSISNRLLESTEARNQSIDELLLEIDQSIAVSRHTMRLLFSLSVILTIF